VDPAIRYKALKAQPGYFAAKGVETGKNDGLRGIVNDQVYAGGGFNGADVPAFPPDDLSFDLVGFEVEYSNSVFNSLFRSGSLDALDHDLAGFLIGFLLCFIDNFLLDADST
jgi:hypothetical protein